MIQTALVVFALATPLGDGPVVTLPAPQPAANSKTETTPVVAAETSDRTKTESSSQAQPKNNEAKTKPAPKRVPKIYLTTRAEKDAYKAKYQKLARASFSSKKPNPGIVVPQLVNMYNELRLVQGLQRSELARMKKTLRLRMESLRQKLHRDIANTKRYKNSATRRLTSRVVPKSTYASNPKSSNQVERSNGESPSKDTPPEGLAATEQQNAQALINLIETTIDPGSWESRGGNGSIFYYAPLHALVIRQTEDVHRQIGGVLGNINK
jgi:hypothetical protein